MAVRHLLPVMELWRDKLAGTTHQFQGCLRSSSGQLWVNIRQFEAIEGQCEVSLGQIVSNLGQSAPALVSFGIGGLAQRAVFVNRQHRDGSTGVVRNQ